MSSSGGFQWWDDFVNWIRSLFWDQNLELALLGLQNSGKTTLLNVIVGEKQNNENLIPTIGFNSRKVTKGAVSIKAWDIGGQSRFRHMWPQYARSTDAIVFVMDAADQEKMDESKKELYELIGVPELINIPLLVVANKQDLDEAMSPKEVIEYFELEGIDDREVACMGTSAKNDVGVDDVLKWLIKHAKTSDE